MKPSFGDRLFFLSWVAFMVNILVVLFALVFSVTMKTLEPPPLWLLAPFPFALTGIFVATLMDHWSRP